MLYTVRLFFCPFFLDVLLKNSILHEVCVNAYLKMTNSEDKINFHIVNCFSNYPDN